MKVLLSDHPIQTWAFFFGLIVASSIFIIKGISGWKLREGGLLALGIALGATVCTLSPTNTPDDLWFIFLSGALAICAMILPGISGSFILLILGKYEYIMGRITELTSGTNVGSNLLILGVFMLGAVVGILGFSKLLRWVLSKWNKETLIILAGFIIGSLVKVWPWSNTEAIIRSQFPDKVGEFIDKPIPPGIIDQYAGTIDMQVTSAVIFAAIGFLLVIGIEFAGKVKASAEEKA
jgi:putative membrane protein